MLNVKEKIRPAIADLQADLETYSTNAPINEREGNKGQAKLEREHEADIKSLIGEANERPKIESIIKTLRADLKAAQDKLKG